MYILKSDLEISSNKCARFKMIKKEKELVNLKEEKNSKIKKEFKVRVSWFHRATILSKKTSLGQETIPKWLTNIKSYLIKLLKITKFIKIRWVSNQLAHLVFLSIYSAQDQRNRESTNLVFQINNTVNLAFSNLNYKKWNLLKRMIFLSEFIE